jgi:hypothetical protein
MTTFTERHYRQRVKAADLVSFHVVIKETDLWVMADRNLEKETTADRNLRIISDPMTLS